MIIDGEHMRNLRERLSQMWLIKVTGVVVKVSMGDIFLMRRRPDCILSVLLATRC